MRKLNFFLKKARESDEVYIYLINKIINLFKTNSQILINNINAKKYRINLTELNFYNHKILNPTIFGNDLDLVVYNRKNNSRGKYKLPYRGSRPTIFLYLDSNEWERLDKGDNFFQDLMRVREGTLKHEITHFLDSTRFLKPRSAEAVSTYGSKNTGIDSFGYVNSTEELQARIMSMISFIMEELFEGDLTKNLSNLYEEKWLPIYTNKSGNRKENFLATLINYVKEDKPNLFIDSILDIASTFYIGDKDLLEKTKRKYIVRIYDLFITLKNKLENKQLEEYGDSPEYIKL